MSLSRRCNLVCPLLLIVCLSDLLRGPASLQYSSKSPLCIAVLRCSIMERVTWDIQGFLADIRGPRTCQAAESRAFLYFVHRSSTEWSSDGETPESYNVAAENFWLILTLLSVPGKVFACHPRSNQTNLTGTQMFSAERLHSWSFDMRLHSNSEQHCTTTTRLWSSNLYGLCRSACCIWFTQSFFALVTADQARDSRQDSQINEDPVQQLC